MARLGRALAATYAEACWYDRAGYGWSNPAPFPHPSSAIAEDLHRLLARAAACGAVMSAGVIRWRPAVITI
jgi:hypothetical protein